jgi:hypothetical protein
MPQPAWKYWLNHAYFTFMFSITPMSAIAHDTAYPAPHLTSRGSNIAEFNVQLDPARLEDQILSPWLSIPSVSELSNVQSTDWAVEALRLLTQTYQLDENGLDAIVSENWTLTRYEFAQLLSTVLEQIAEHVKQGVSQKDLSVLQRLQEEFSTELVEVNDRIRSSNNQLDEIEANQFSVTTTLRGDVSFLIADVFGEDTNVNTSVSYRARLRFDTSFTGEDLLRVRIRAGNFERFGLDNVGNEDRLSATSSSDNEVGLSSLQYRFPVGDRATILVVADGGNTATFTDTINPVGGSSLSRFANRNPIYRVPSVSVGAGASFEVADELIFDVGYLAGSADSPRPKNGLFNGDYGAIAQLMLDTRRFNLGLTYIHAYSTDGSVDTGTGSELAEVSGTGQPVVSNSYGLQARFEVTRQFEVGGWVGYTAARVIETGDADVWNYAITLAFSDLGKEGNLGGLVVGMQPRLTGASPALAAELGRGQDADVGLHLEGFYEYHLNDFVTITAGVIWLTAPNHNAGNPDIVIGVIRTELRF